MRRLAPAAVLLAALAPAVPVTAVTPARRVAVAQARPSVEVAFVLDTTGSMGGLIEGAKRRIWSIARRIGEGQPRPDLRIALVGYRDVGDAYVTRVHDFSGDMDEVFQRLTSFRAEGGGDAPEHVSRALADAVGQLSWSRGQQPLRMIFLVGDAPPHVDYQDGFDYRRHVEQARERGIVVEAIQCGPDPATAQVWREIASLGQGHYARIDSQGGMPVKVTPQDAELARLNGELARTVVAAGTAAEQAAVGRKLEGRAAMPSPAAAEAASYYAGAGALADQDLVDLPAAEQKRELQERKKAGQAPAALANKSDDEALAYLGAQKERRQQIQSRIALLQKQRETFLRRDGQPQDAFDEQVVTSLRERAEAHGIKY
jgi:Mg-chelatase subunit ChlD